MGGEREGFVEGTDLLDLDLAGVLFERHPPQVWVRLRQYTLAFSTPTAGKIRVRAQSHLRCLLRQLQAAGARQILNQQRVWKAPEGACLA